MTVRTWVFKRGASSTDGAMGQVGLEDNGGGMGPRMREDKGGGGGDGRGATRWRVGTGGPRTAPTGEERGCQVARFLDSASLRSE